MSTLNTTVVNVLQWWTVHGSDDLQKLVKAITVTAAFREAATLFNGVTCFYAVYFGHRAGIFTTR